MIWRVENWKILLAIGQISTSTPVLKSYISHDIRGGKWKSFEKLWNIFHFHMILRVENGKVFLAMGQISTSTGSIEKLWNIFHMLLMVENWKVFLAMGQISTSTPAQYWKKPLSSQQTQSVFIPEQLFSLIIYSETINRDEENVSHICKDGWIHRSKNKKVSWRNIIHLSHLGYSETLKGIQSPYPNRLG